MTIGIMKLQPGNYEVQIDLAQQLSDISGVSKDKCAGFLADEFMKLIGLI